MMILHAQGMRAGVRETCIPYHDETFVIPFSLLCCIYTAEHSITFGDHLSPLPLLGPARGDAALADNQSDAIGTARAGAIQL
jgi:hypothetical protein